MRLTLLKAPDFSKAPHGFILTFLWTRGHYGRPFIWLPTSFWTLCFSVIVSVPAIGEEPANATRGAKSSLPLPSSMSLGAYDERLFSFLNRQEYKTLGWLSDKCVRDTGPYL